MINDYTFQIESQQHERELTERLERRRLAAERAVTEHGGSRLAVIAHLARQARGGHSAAAHPAGW
nr:hypothetical protein [Aeromicrobium sp.]